MEEKRKAGRPSDKERKKQKETEQKRLLKNLDEKEKTKMIVAKSNCKKYITTYADLDELKKIEEYIEDRRNYLKGKTDKQKYKK